MAVWCTDIGPSANQEVHNIIMAPADGIVKGSDAFVVGLARVAHLWKTLENARFYNRKNDTQYCYTGAY